MLTTFVVSFTSKKRPLRCCCAIVRMRCNDVMGDAIREIYPILAYLPITVFSPVDFCRSPCRQPTNIFPYMDRIAFRYILPELFFPYHIKNSTRTKETDIRLEAPTPPMVGTRVFDIERSIHGITIAGCFSGLTTISHCKENS